MKLYAEPKGEAPSVNLGTLLDKMRLTDRPEVFPN